MSASRRIAVVGGGVIGASVAWHLAEHGAGEIVLIERDRLGSGTTWHSAGNITWKPIADSDAPVAYMLDLIARLERETGQSTGWLRTGRLFLARSTDAMQALEGLHARALSRGIEGQLLAPAEVPSHHLLVDPDALVGAWLNPRSGRLAPADLVAAYAKGFRDRGGEIREECTVAGLEIRNGAVRALATGAGAIPVDAVVVCTGLWSRGLLAGAGLGLAHGACEHFYAIARPDPPLARDTPSFICAEHLIYGREEVGGFLVGFFDRDAKVLDPATLPEPFAFTLLGEDWDQVAPYYQEAVEIFPALADAPVRRLVNGPESFTPDGRPLIGPVDGVDGLFVACAMNSAGVTLSGMAGHAIADLLLEREPRFTQIDFAPRRFGARGADRAWVDAEMPAAPSRFYLAHNEAD